MRPASFVATSISVASMRPLLLAKPSGRSVRVNFHQAKKPALAPRSTTAAAISHFLSLLVRWARFRHPGAWTPGRGRNVLRGLLFGGRLRDDFRLWLLRLDAHVRLPLLVSSFFTDGAATRSISVWRFMDSAAPSSEKGLFYCKEPGHTASPSCPPCPRRRPCDRRGTGRRHWPQDESKYRAKEMWAEFSATVVGRNSAGGDFRLAVLDIVRPRPEVVGTERSALISFLPVDKKVTFGYNDKEKQPAKPDPLRETMIRDYSLTGVNAALAIEKGLAEADWYTAPVPKAEHAEAAPAPQRAGDPRHGLAGGPAAGHRLRHRRALGHVVGRSIPYLVYAVLYGTSSDSRWHECGHGTAFKTDWMNTALYEIASFMVMRESVVWRWSHNRHHSDTIIVGRDPEIRFPGRPIFGAAS